MLGGRCYHGTSLFREDFMSLQALRCIDNGCEGGADEHSVICFVHPPTTVMKHQSRGSPVLYSLFVSLPVPVCVITEQSKFPSWRL